MQINIASYWKRTIDILFPTDDHSITSAEFTKDWVVTYAIGNGKEAAKLFSKADVNADGVINKDDLPFVFTYFDMDSKFLSPFEFKR